MLAEALEAVGDREAARDALAPVVALVEARRRAIDDPEVAAAFDAIAEHRRLRALAAQIAARAT